MPLAIESLNTVTRFMFFTTSLYVEFPGTVFPLRKVIFLSGKALTTGLGSCLLSFERLRISSTRSCWLLLAVSERGRVFEIKFIVLHPKPA